MIRPSGNVKTLSLRGWLRNGITGLAEKVSCGRIVRWGRHSTHLRMAAGESKHSARFNVSTQAGLFDRARGFYRGGVPAGFSCGGVLANSRLTSRYQAIYAKAFQGAATRIDKTAVSGRRYQGDLGVDLSLGGVMRFIPIGVELPVYVIRARFLDGRPVWEDLPAGDETGLYSREE